MTIHIVNSEALAALRRLPSNTFHSMCTDPPAGIGFMAKSWDDDKGGPWQWINWLTEIMREAYRVLRPGAQAFVWAIPRTSHWTAVALQQAGFEIRDRVHHVFGSGMPHAKDASKAIDLYYDVPMSLRPVVGTYRAGGNAGLSTEEKGGTYGVGVGTTEAIELKRTTGYTADAQQWDGWYTNLKPGCEDWWLVRKPLEGTLAENLLKWGCGALNIDSGRIPRNWDERGEAWKRGGHSAKPEAEKIAAPPGQGMILHPGGSWSANIVFTHSEDCRFVGTKKAKRNVHDAPNDDSTGIGRAGPGFKRKSHTVEEDVPVFECAVDCPVGQLDEQSPSGSYNSGGVSRYFNVFYRPKATRKEREAGCEEAGLPVRSGGEATGRKDGSAGVDRPQAGAGRGGGRRNDHPTIKDVGTGDEPGLMRWLVRMVTPPKGLCLDPFVGSGSTPVACVIDGFECLGIDEESHYCDISRARVAYWEREKA